MAAVLAFMGDHWFLTLALALIAVGVVNGLLVLVTRFYRMVMVLLRGWPPAHLDADGDWRPPPPPPPAPEVKQ